MKVYIHGNCQAYILAGLLADACPAWDIAFFEVHADPILNNLEEYRRRVRHSDIIISQPVHENYRGVDDLALSWIKREMKPDGALVVIPSAHFSGHHPEFAGLTALGDLCNNSVAAHLVAAGVEPSSIVEKMLSPNLFSEEAMRTEIQLQLDEMHAREASDRHDVSIKDFIEDYAVRFQLFHIVNHPTRPVYAAIANRILAHLGWAGEISFTGADPQPVPHMPMCPAIARYCERSNAEPPHWLPEGGDLVIAHQWPAMTLPEYFGHMIGQLRRHSPEAIREAIAADWRSRAFLHRLAKAKADIPGIELWDQE